MKALLKDGWWFGLPLAIVGFLLVALKVEASPRLTEFEQTRLEFANAEPASVERLANTHWLCERLEWQPGGFVKLSGLGYVFSLERDKTLYHHGQEVQYEETQHGLAGYWIYEGRKTLRYPRLTHNGTLLIEYASRVTVPQRIFGILPTHTLKKLQLDIQSSFESVVDSTRRASSYEICVAND